MFFRYARLGLNKGTKKFARPYCSYKVQQNIRCLLGMTSIGGASGAVVNSVVALPAILTEGASFENRLNALGNAACRGAAVGIFIGGCPVTIPLALLYSAYRNATQEDNVAPKNNSNQGNTEVESRQTLKGP